MKKFDIFQSQDGTINVIKSGFCWPGFFFSMLWLGAKGLWKQLAILLTMILLSFFGLAYLATLSTDGVNNNGMDGLQTLFQLCVAVYVGWAGNEWVADKMKANGHRVKSQIEAKNKAAALALAAAKWAKPAK